MGGHAHSQIPSLPYFVSGAIGLKPYDLLRARKRSYGLSPIAPDTKYGNEGICEWAWPPIALPLRHPISGPQKVVGPFKL